MKRWIFQDIADIKEKVLYDNTVSLRERIRNYNNSLRESIEPELYVRYCINQCDIYVDVTSIMVAARNVYPSLSYKQIGKWIEKHKESHHVLTY